jgi:tetratricopeptide (TPR) repeat protein
MAGEPLFDLELIGYRNDLARERVLALLRGLPETAHLAAIARDTPLPHRLEAELPHAQGLRLLGALRDQGAHVRLVASAASAVVVAPPPIAPPVASPPHEGPRLVLGVVLIATVAAGLFQLLPRPQPALPPNAIAPQPLDVAAGAAASTHRLNDEAVGLNASGSFSAAAERLRAALADAPAEAVLRRNLRTVLQNWAVAELNADQPANAVPLLEEALSIDEDAATRGVLGVAHVRQGDYRSGRELLERATAQGVADPASLTALATAYRQLGDRAAAVDALHRAREAGARGPEFDAMVTRAEREMDAEWDFDETRSAHFTIGFAGEHDSVAAADLVAQGLERSYFHVGSKLDLYPDERVPVVLYPSEDFHDVTQTPSWSAGVYDGRIKLPVGGLMASDEDVLERTLRHEYGHVLVHLLSRGRAPVWLNEGVAIWVEEDRDGDRADWAERAVAGQPLFHLSELDGAFTRLPADRVHTAYAQSYLAVRALVDRHGAGRVRTLLEEIGKGASFERAYRDSLYGDPAAFEAELIRKLTS